jgi:RNA polymerase sigma-70 factor (ECF subfamily)
MNQSTIRYWYEKYKNGIFRYALSITKNTHLAEDVLHDTFVKVMSGNRECAEGKEQAWLYRIARNLCYDRLRRGKYEQSHLPTPDQSENPYEYIELIASLPPKDREIVTLKIVGGLTQQEIGAVLGISARAAQKRYERAIATLREKED